MISDSRIRSVFFRIESDPSVFDYRIDGISIYFILRFPLEMQLRNFHSAMPPRKQGNILNRLRSAAGKLIRSSKGNGNSKKVPVNDPLLPSSFLFVSTSDWTIAPGESMELTDIIKYYRNAGEPINFVQPDYSGNIQKQAYHDSFSSIDVNKIYPLRFDEKQLVDSCIDHVQKGLGIDLDDERDALKRHVSKVLGMSYQLREIICKVQPKYVFARSVYTEPWIPIACSLAGTDCVEVQHGVMTPDNIYYQSPHLSNIGKGRLLFPDHIFTLGEQWRQILIAQQNHYHHNNVHSLGFKHPAAGQRQRKGRLRMLVCLQPGVFSMDDFLKQFIEEYGSGLLEAGIQVIIRPHPNNITGTTEIYRRYLNTAIMISNSREVNFYEELNCSDIVFSASSMCLYEAISMGIPAVSLEKFRPVTISSHLKYVKSCAEMFEFILAVQTGLYQQVCLSYMEAFNENVLGLLLNGKAEAVTNC